MDNTKKILLVDDEPSIRREPVARLGHSNRSIGVMAAIMALSMGGMKSIGRSRVIEPAGPPPQPRPRMDPPPMRFLPGTLRKEHANTKENARRLRQIERNRKP